MTPTITIVDYEKGNLRSVAHALERSGARVEISADARVVECARALILPGVGAFEDAARTLQECGLTDAMRRALNEGASFLGICLGLHLMFETSEEGSSDEESPSGESPARGLGIIKGKCIKLPNEDMQGKRYKIPHVGWNTIEWDNGAYSQGSHCPLFEGIPPQSYFYFTHSYSAPPSEYTVATTVHSVRFPSAVMASDRIFGVQFHPEKSSDIGAKLMDNFLSVTTRYAYA